MKKRWLILLLTAVLCAGQSLIYARSEKQQNLTTKSEDHTEKLVQKSGHPSTNKNLPKTLKTFKKTKEGQTMLDVSKANITITKNGAVGGGLSQNETELNSKGYYISGTTDKYNVIVEKTVKADITLENVNIECDENNYNCIDVSHADVIITLKGKNRLVCNSGKGDAVSGCALAKDGMDGSLILQCESVDIDGHQCNSQCGTLTAEGNKNQVHAGAIGSTGRMLVTDASQIGFSNFTIKGGNIEVSAGQHCAGIGAACGTEYYNNSACTKNIRISGGNIKATGTEYGPGIGSAYGSEFNGLYITGGKVEAKGGAYAPGIGTTPSPQFPSESHLFKNVKISGGDTVVIAIGDEGTNMPGIGAPEGTVKMLDVSAEPDQGYQGYIQDGMSLNQYEFMAGTPFKESVDITVGKFCTKIYFGPFRDANEINQDSKDQIGANHVISKSGGREFTQDVLKQLTKVAGKREDGTDYGLDSLNLVDLSQLKIINKAKLAGEVGDFPLSYSTPNGTTMTVTVFLRSNGYDASEFKENNPKSCIGANNIIKETGGNFFTEAEIKQLAKVKAKNKDGISISLDELKIDEKEFKILNETKTAGKAGSFNLTFTASDGSKVSVIVTLTGEYDEITEDKTTKEIMKGKNIISKTGGKVFTKEQLKTFAMVKAYDEDGNPINIEEIELSDTDQVTAINESKTAGKTGDFPLTFQTKKKTAVTIHVFLREDGTDSSNKKSDDVFSTIGASSITYPTKGSAFTETEIIRLCQVKGKDINGDNANIFIDHQELKIINSWKIKGVTGSFHLTFSLADGTSAGVKVTLTGSHNVIFDSKGGNYTPQTQVIQGGGNAVKPSEPHKESFIFIGWFYSDENNKEIEWDFNTPIHQDILLIAKWQKKINESVSENVTTVKKEKTTKKIKGKKRIPDWEYRKRDKSGKNSTSSSVGKTGDEQDAVCLVVALSVSIISLLAIMKVRIRK